MAVTKVCIGKKPTATFGDSDELSVPFLVETDDPLDGPEVVRLIFGNASPGPDTIPSRGGAWSWGNDIGTGAIVDSHEVTLLKSKPVGNTFRVTPIFVRESNEPSQPNPQGGKAQAPGDVQNVLKPGYRQVTQPIQKAEFLGYFDNQGDSITPANATLTVGDVSPIGNSALLPFIPFPERTFGMPILTLRKYYRTWNANFDDAIGKVNSAAYQINFVDGSGTSVYNRTFDPDTLLLYNVDPAQVQFGNEVWYYISIEFWIDIDGFNKDRADLGNSEIKDVPNKKDWQTITSESGHQTAGLKKLDGKGKLLATPDDPSTLVYVRWREYEQYNFTTLGITY